MARVVLLLLFFCGAIGQTEPANLDSNPYSLTPGMAFDYELKEKLRQTEGPRPYAHWQLQLATAVFVLNGVEVIAWPLYFGHPEWGNWLIAFQATHNGALVLGATTRAILERWRTRREDKLFQFLEQSAEKGVRISPAAVEAYTPRMPSSRCVAALSRLSQ